MGDPLLRAWTTQYTNSPITTPRSATPGERRLRPLRDERVEKPRNPKNPLTPPDMSMPYAVSSVPQGNTCNVDRGNGALEYINPSLLLLPQDHASPESNNYARVRRVSDRRVGQFPCTRPNTPNMEGVSNVSASDQRSSQSGRNGREEQSSPPVDIFEGILAKMLAFDVVRPPSTNELGNDEPPREVEAKQPIVHHGFAISVGWSSTFFPDDIQEGSGHSRNTVDTVGHF
ncbi:uncharacterized protein BDW70DRAFT_170851 [Aspergillus foveolatus]|uniref:uncharacterized protein n=1 Tax=Aspergillus foveolatus TaxID=210207 RepID=UPI003CCDE06E